MPLKNVRNIAFNGKFSKYHKRNHKVNELLPEYYGQEVRQPEWAGEIHHNCRDIKQ